MKLPLRVLREIPKASTDGVFDDSPGSWSVLRETNNTRTNLVPNPSAEASGSDGWFQGGVSSFATTYPVRSTAQSIVGAASFSFVGNNAVPQPQVGFFFTPPALGHYVLSWWMMKTGNLQSLEFNTGTSATPDGIVNRQIINRRTFVHTDGTTSTWFRFAYSFDVITLTDKFIRFRGNQFTAGETFTIYLDGIMIEHAPLLQDYFDGSSTGAVWQGLPNNSISSLGYQFNKLSDYGFTMQAMVGGNAPSWNTISTPFALGGGYYQQSTPQMSEFSIVGTIEADGRIDLERKRRALSQLLSPRNNAPVKLIYRPARCNDQYWTTPLQIEGVYTGGLEGNLNNEYQESVALSFRIHTPYIASDISDQQLNIVINKQVPVLGGLLRRDPQGVYHQMNYLAGGTLQARTRGPNGMLYAAYSFAANDVKVYILDEVNLTETLLGAFTATSSSPDPCEIKRLRFDPNGNLWAMGNFNAIGGNPFNNLAKWDGAIWTSNIASITEGYATGVANVQDIQWTTDGTAYVVGNFDVINGNSMKNFAKYVAGVFTAVGAGLNGAVLDTEPGTFKLMMDTSNVLYIYGRFDGSGANVSRNFWKFTPATSVFAAINSVGTELGHKEIYRAIILQNGSIITVGDYQFVDGVDMQGVNTWQGSSWSRVPVLEPYYILTQVSQHPNGLIELGHTTTEPYTGGWLQYNGNVLIRPEYRPMLDTWVDGITRVTFNSFYFVDAYPDGMQYLYGAPNAATANVYANVPNTNVLDNQGDLNTWPTFSFLGPINVFNITNATTGRTIHLDLQVAAGDFVTLKLYPVVNITSVLRGDITNSILAGSQTRDFQLVPGDNNLNFGTDVLGATDTRIMVTWRNHYDSLGAVFG